MEHWYLRNSYVVHVPTLGHTWSDQDEFENTLPAEMRRNFNSLATFKTLLKYNRNALNLCYDPKVRGYGSQFVLSVILPGTS